MTAPAAVVGDRWHGGRMARLVVVVAAIITLYVAGPAGADPGPAPAPPGPGGFGSGWAQCGDQLVPADPRVDVSNPLGGLIYREMLRRMCDSAAQDGTQPTPPPQPGTEPIA